MTLKRAKHIELGDYIVVSENEHLCVRKIDHQENTIKIYGFINGCTDCTIKIYGYMDLIKIWERENNKNESKLIKVLKILKKILFIS